jgi:RNA polymerase sigma-70 factor (ECF subfamily)
MASERNAVGIDELLAHAGWARSLARSLVRDTSTADDVVQDTWLAALHAGPKNRGNLRGWLARAVTNVAARRARADERRSRRETDHDAREPLPTPEELALELDTQRILAEEVARLPEPLRSVVLLRFYSGRTAHEIALDAGVSEVAVRARLREALARLRARLDARSVLWRCRNDGEDVCWHLRSAGCGVRQVALLA